MRRPSGCGMTEAAREEVSEDVRFTLHKRFRTQGSSDSA